MAELTPSAIATLCEALHQGKTGALHPDTGWMDVDLTTGVIEWDRWFGNVRTMAPDLADVWRSRAPTWAQPALDGRPVSPPATTQPEASAEGQGELWSMR